MTPRILALSFAVVCASFGLAATELGDSSESASASTPPKNRFEQISPLAGLPSITIDSVADSVGIAHQTAKSKSLQARILWIDATANIGKINTEEKIAALVERIQSAGFNTIVLDSKPIVGYTLFKSSIAPKMTEWKGVIVGDFDPLGTFVKYCKQRGVSIFASLNAFSEGHSLIEKGPGYDHPEWQTTLYEIQGQVRSSSYFKPSFNLMDRPNMMTTTDDQLAVFTDLNKLPKQIDNSKVVVLDELGNVLAQADGSAVKTITISVPVGGSALVGIGRGAEYLRIYAKPDDKMTFEGTSTFVPITKRPWQQIPLMMNPNNPAVRSRELAILEDLVKNYDIDGVIYDDRLRYAGLNADFSDITREQFEKYVGERVVWPNDIFTWTLLPDLTRGIKPGKFYDAWLTFRATTMRDYIAEARKIVDRVRPGTQLGIYAGSWYGEYPNFGSNYAATDVEAGFRFLTTAYQKTGFADYLDFIIPGCYYQRATIAEAMADNTAIGRTVEAAGQLVNRMVHDKAWVYAGIMIDSFKGDVNQLRNAMQASIATTQGIMVFDLSHDIDKVWNVFQLAFATKAIAPHAVPGLLTEVRNKRAQLDKQGVKDPAVIIHAGSVGTGM
jgi:uncharacterized lipoprotein YddW (UPF0748 family)